MSYARWNCDGSTVYVFGAADGLTCLDCTLRDEEGDTFVASTWQGMIDHLEAHREAGHIVPQSAIDRLKEDMEQAICCRCYEVDCTCEVTP